MLSGCPPLCFGQRRCQTRALALREEAGSPRGLWFARVCVCAQTATRPARRRLWPANARDRQTARRLHGHGAVRLPAHGRRAFSQYSFSLLPSPRFNSVSSKSKLETPRTRAGSSEGATALPRTPAPTCERTAMVAAMLVVSSILGSASLDLSPHAFQLQPGRLSGHASAALLCQPESPGIQNQRRQRGEARHNLLSELLRDPAARCRSTVTSSAIDGLLRRGDTYDAGDFSQRHVDFKAGHNAIFVSLAKWAHAGHACDCVLAEQRHSLPAPNVFYLDGSDGGTTRALRASGFATSQLHVANLFHDTVEALVNPPLDLDPSRVVLGRAEDALRDDLADIPFAAVYLDGCGGAARPLSEMAQCVFQALGAQARASSRLALGFTLTQAHPSGRSLADREQVQLSLCAHAHPLGIRVPSLC